MSNSGIKTRFDSSPVAILQIAVVYAVVARVSFLFTIPPGNITPIFPAAGLALAAVMVMGRNTLIGVWLGSFAANTISFIDGSMPSVQTGLANVPVGAFIGLGAMSGAAAGAFLVRSLCKDEHPLQSGRNVLILVVAGALGSCLISPTFGVLSLSLAGNIPWERFGYSWITWWVGDAAGTLVAAPLLLAWQQRHPFGRNAWRISEAAMLGGMTLLVCFFVFFRNTPCEYALLPLLLWAAFRFGMRGVSTTAAVIALLATIGTSRGSSPFVGASTNESLLLLNSFFGVTIICALFLAGLMEERRRADEKLYKLNLALRAISECNQALIHATDETALLNHVCRLLTDVSGYCLAWVGLAEQDEAKTLRPVAQAGFEEGYLETLRITWADTEGGRGPAGAAIRTGQPCAAHDILTNPDFAPWRAQALKCCYASSLVLPLKTGDRVLGALNIYSVKPDGFDAEETKLLADLADDLTYGIVALRISAKQKQAETALRESEERLRLLGDNLPDSYVYQLTREADGTVRFLHLSAGVEKLHGVKVDDVLRDASLLRRQIAREQVPVLQAAEEASLRNLTDFTMELRMRCADGQWRWMQVCSRPRRTSGGQVVWDGVGTDITARKQAEAASRAADQRLAESERQYRELVELANSIILRWTSEGIITFLNEFGLRFFGYSATEILGRHVMDTIVPPTESDGRDLRQLMEQICANPKAFEQNVNENMLRSGDRVWIAWTNKIVLDVDGNVAEILSVGTDITEHKRAEEEIRQLHEDLQRYAAELERRVDERTAELAVARDRAEAADRLKSAFLASMSHELRTPLNSIIGFTGIVLQGLAGPLNPEQNKQLEMVRGSARHLLALINDVLDISKVEAGQLEVTCEPFDLRASIEKAAAGVKLLAQKKALDLQVELAPEIGAWTSDQRRVEQILINLLNNAIKFTEHGQVTLTAEIVRSTLRISVTDTGIGIDPDDFQKIFHPFRQIDTGLARNHEGTGLGLAICRRLAELLGGEIRVESEWGKGSTFTVVLPVKGGVAL